MKIYSPKTLLKISSIIFVSFFGFYIYEIYLNGFNTNYNFWCIQIESNFYMKVVGNISLPIHCDEGPYRLASNSIENFFNKSNPYQTRPVYVLIISLIRQLVELMTFSQISDYQNFRISMIIIQISFLSAIIFLFSSLMNLTFKTSKDYLIIILLIGIPGIRWNLLFPSAGNITLLLFLITLKFATEKSFYNGNKNKIFAIFSVLSLAHLSSIVYGFILEFFDLMKKRKVQFKKTFGRIALLFSFPTIYISLVYFSSYSFYDWHTGVYSQFSWIIYELREGTFFNFETLIRHLNTYTKITIDYINYFFLSIVYLLSLLVILFFNKKQVPKKIKFSFLINLIIFSFWGLQGIYETFRFTNYSIGYFIFISIYILIIEAFDKNKYLIFSMIFYLISIDYLGPYNEEIRFATFNNTTYFSVLLFSVFIYKQIKLEIEKVNNDS